MKLAPGHWPLAKQPTNFGFLYLMIFDAWCSMASDIWCIYYIYMISDVQHLMIFADIWWYLISSLKWFNDVEWQILSVPPILMVKPMVLCGVSPKNQRKFELDFSKRRCQNPQKVGFTPNPLVHHGSSLYWKCHKLEGKNKSPCPETHIFFFKWHGMVLLWELWCERS